MINLKKTTITVLALASHVVFAGSMGPVCSAVNVTVPCEATTWEFGAKALYLEHAAIYDSGYHPVLPATELNRSTDYGWGFELDGAYHFNTGNDVSVNWYHMSRSDYQSYGPHAPVGFSDPILGTTTVAVKGGSSSTALSWDAVNVELGQHVDFGDAKAIRFHGGVQYVDLTHKLTNNDGSLITLETIPASYSHTINFNPAYLGVGPRLGMDMSYGLNHAFSIYANGATAILAGTRSFNLDYTDSLGNSVGFSDSKTAVVPAIDAKLGVTYTHALAQGDMIVDAGWMWVDYVDVHRNVAGEERNFSLQGPFLGLKWLGNVV